MYLQGKCLRNSKYDFINVFLKLYINFQSQNYEIKKYGFQYNINYLNKIKILTLHPLMFLSQGNPRSLGSALNSLLINPQYLWTIHWSFRFMFSVGIC